MAFQYQPLLFSGFTTVGTSGGGGGGVTAVTATGVLSSSGGTVPNITFTGILPPMNGGTGISNNNSHTLTLTAIASVGGTNTGDITLGTANGLSLSGQVLSLATFTSSTAGAVPASGGGTTNFLRADGTWAPVTASGTVTTVSVVTANGLAGTVSNPTTTPAITLSTYITGILKGNGTAISAATPGTDYVIPSGSITGTASNITATSNSTLTTLSSLSLPYSQVTGGPTPLVFADSLVNTSGTVTLVNDSASPAASQYYGTDNSSTLGYYNLPASNPGTVTSVSVTSANGFSGTVATPTSTPAITISTSVTGILYGNGTSVAAAIPANFPTLNQNTTGTASNITATSNSTLTTLSSLSLPYSQVTGAPGGTVTSVALADGSTTPIYTVSGSPVTSSGTLTLTLNTQTAATFLAGPISGGAAQPTFRVIVASDLPSISLTSGVSGILPVANGGTGSSTIAGGPFLALNGSNSPSATIDWGTQNLVDVAQLGIGTTSPATGTAIDIVNNTGSTQRIIQTGYGANVGTRNRYANGTLVSPTAATSGNILGFISGMGYGTSTFPTSSTAALNFVAQGTFTNASMPTAVQINTTPTGSITSTIAATFNPNGQLTLPAFYTSYGAVVNDSSGNLTTATPGTAGQVLTSNGTGSLPTFQPFSSSGLTEPQVWARVAYGM
jgi:trimeric autotransporter adhesin